MRTHVMRRSDREKKGAAESFGIPYRPEPEDYPHGLRVSLDTDSLRKLGITEMPKPGDKYRIEGEMHVLESAQRDTEEDSDRRVELVLHELGCEPAGSGGGDKTIREELEDARHQARGSTAPGGRGGGAPLGSRLAGRKRANTGYGEG